jgi:hypothetical protein
VLGVAEGTIRNDLRNSDAESAQQIRTHPATKAERRAVREVQLAAKQQALPSKKYGVIPGGPPGFHLHRLACEFVPNICYEPPMRSEGWNSVRVNGKPQHEPRSRSSPLIVGPDFICERTAMIRSAIRSAPGLLCDRQP